LVADTSYEATLQSRGSSQQIREFARLSDAILWLAGEFEAGDGNAEHGEIRYRGAVLWRKRAALSRGVG
jgi:hypothetical protein